MPDLPTSNNLYNLNIGYTVLQQLQALSEAVNDSDVPDIPEDNNPTGFLIGLEAARQIKYIAENIGPLLSLVAAIPTADAEDGETIWNDEGVLKVSSSG